MKSREYVTSDIESSDDEGGIKNLDYKPPSDFSLYKAKKHTTSTFDADETVNHELWLIRVPDNVTNEDLASMKIEFPNKHAKSSETTILGSLKKKETSAHSSSSTSTKYQLQTVSAESGFAGEMMALQPLVPDSSKGGRLVQAPLGIQQHLILVASPSIPSGEPLAEEILNRPIPKRAQPEGLKQRFQFAGSESQVPGEKVSTKSGKKFAAEWAKTLEARKIRVEEALRAAQEAEAEEDEEEEEEEEQEAQAEEVVAEVVEAVEAVEEAKEEESSTKKRKGEDMEVDAKDEKKAKKEKKEKKEKKSKKEKN
ncbi:hypothetical protein CPB97_011976 [Podila verticillata]|nr:hypothetical protein CPB97_011976 [Podila verticillata]